MKLNRLFFVVALLGLGILSGYSQFNSSATPPDISDTTATPFNKTSAEKSPVIIADIFIVGNKKTKPYIIEREIPFKVGQAMLRSDLPGKMELAREQLMNTTLFNEVEVKLEKQEDDLVFIRVNVTERWYFFPLPYFKIVARNFNEWWVDYNRSLQRIIYGVKLTHNSLSGRNDDLRLTLVTGYTQQASFSYNQAAADKNLRFGYNIGFDYSRNKEVNYKTDSNKLIFYRQDNFLIRNFRGEIGFSYRPKIRTRHNLKFAYNTATVDTSVIKLNTDFFPSGKTKLSFLDIYYTVNYFNVDYIPYPTKGITFYGQLMKRGFNREVDMWQLNATATYTIPVFTKSQIYLQATGTIKLPFDQPFYNKRLFGYGDLYMRGLEYYVSDGIAGFVARATARREVLNFNIKPPIKIAGHNKIPFRILLKAYGDVGYAYDKQPSHYTQLNNKLLRTWGVGVDIVSFYDFVVRLEYSFNQLNQQGLFIHSRNDF